VSAIAEVAFFTDDLEGTLTFYRLVLGTDPVAEWPGGAIYAVGDVKVLVHDWTSGMEGGPPNEDHVAVAVRDLDAACAGLRACGLSLLVEPREFPWGRSAYLRDPDGRLVELTQP